VIDYGRTHELGHIRGRPLDLAESVRLRQIAVFYKSGGRRRALESGHVWVRLRAPKNQRELKWQNYRERFPGARSAQFPQVRPTQYQPIFHSDAFHA
jgi:hypothetical protein